jgi:hypothetical protein
MFCGRIKWWSNRLSDDPLALTQLYISNQYTSDFVFIGFSLEERDYLKPFSFHLQSHFGDCSPGVTLSHLFMWCKLDSRNIVLFLFWEHFEKPVLNIQLGMQQRVPPLSVRVSFLSQRIFIAYQKKQTATILNPTLASLANEFASQVLQKKQHPPS